MIWISVALAAVGLALLVFGVPRRRESRLGEAPSCRKCEYDLTGLVGGNAPTAICPECGSDLNKPGAVRKGLRRRRGRTGKIAALVGAAILATGTSLGAYQAWS